jgi:hypothetical protein
MSLPKDKSLKELIGFNRRTFFPLLKFMFDKPEKINSKKDVVTKFEKDHIISFSYYTENVQYIKLDNYNRCHGIIPKYDFIGRRINLRQYSKLCKKFMDILPVTKIYRIVDSKSLYKVVRRIRKQHPILREYLNLYMSIYEYSTDQLFLLIKPTFFILLKTKLKEDWVQKLDGNLLKLVNKDNIAYLDTLIALVTYIYYQDSRILNQKILAFNFRIQGLKITNDMFNAYKKVNMDILSYGILRQKLRTKLTLIALCSFLKIKQLAKKI